MLILRELCKEDMAIINHWRNDRELINCLGATFRFIDLDVDLKWYDTYMLHRNDTIRCTIIDSNSEKDCLGLVSLTNINFINKSAEFHIMIGDSANRGKGIGSFATTNMLEHAFGDMNLNRIELSVIETNHVAKKLYEKVGFVCEGVKRQAVYKNGKFVDMVIMAVLKDDYFNRYAR